MAGEKQVITIAKMQGCLSIRESTPADREWGLDVLIREWHGPLIERADEFVDASDLTWLVAELNGDRVGLTTLLFGNEFVEIVTINSLVERQGVGTSLVEASANLAKSRGAHDLRLFTTNDNLHAIGFYQKRGFRLYAIHRDTMTRARVVKPEIPVVGHEGIPIMDEIELRLIFDGPRPE